MKILSVEIANITSIEGPYTINFEDDIFLNIGLFGITGPVGAGKSSIIDAICLGLYNKTPRLDKISGMVSIQYESESLNTNNPSNLLRRGAASGHVVVRFTGIDGHVWKTNWMLRRSRNQANGKLQNVTMRLMNETLNEEFPDNRITNVLQKIQELIGLDFKQFTKSVILAQGDFQAFLNASDTDRAQILEKLTGTEIYSSISKSIFEKHSQVKALYQNIESQIQNLYLLSDEEVQEIDKEIKCLGEKSIDLNAKLNALLAIEKWYEVQRSLTNDIQQKQSELQLTQQQIEDLQNEWVLLRQVEAVQEVKPLYLEIEDLNKKNKHLSDEITVLLAQKNENEITLATKSKLIENHEHLLLKLVSEQKNNLPFYKLARELDTTLVGLKNNKQQFESDAENLKEKVAHFLVSKNKIEKDLATNNKSIEAIEQWFLSHENVKNWAENEKLLFSFFDELIEITKSLKLIAKNYKQTQKLHQEHKNELSELNLSIEKLDTEAIVLQNEIDVKQAENQLNSLDRLLKNQEELSNKHLSLTKLLELVQRFDKLTSEKIDLEKKQLLSEKEFKAAKKEIELTEKFLSDTKVALGEKRIYVEQLKIQNSENVVHLKNMLQPGVACPVCGSTEHNVQKQAVVNILLQEAEQDLLVLDTQFNEKQQMLAQNSSKLMVLEHTISNFKIKINELNLDCSSLQFNFDTIQKPEGITAIDQENVVLFLTNKLEITESEILETQKKVVIFTENQQLIERSLSEKNRINQQLEVYRQKSIPLHTRIETQKIELENLTTEGKQLRSKQINFQDKISPILKIENWPKTFENDSEGFKNDIISKINSYNSYVQHKADLVPKLVELAAKLKETDALKIEKETQLQIINDKILQLNHVLTEKEKERNTYFNGETVDAVEIQLNQKVQQLTNEIATQREAYQSIKNKLSGLEAVQSEKEKYKAENLLKIDLNNAKIVDFITDLNTHFQHVILLENLNSLFLKSSFWMAEIREKFTKIEQHAISLQAIKSNLEIQLEKHNATNAPAVALNQIPESRAVIENDIKFTSDALLAINTKKMHHESNKVSQGKLLEAREELTTEYLEWQELNELFGSATGDKLKKLAQQFTLDLLLQAANAQLSQINNRYILERIDQTLSILVVDQYMGNSKRATSSLSGGETFLVSLALSLALSSVSSTQLKVESLFIDEGFGNLDPNSLETAFLALENLQNQGRMVGIISHLDAVTDRLAVKIEVIPQGNGKSKIEIKA